MKFVTTAPYNSVRPFDHTASAQIVQPRKSWIAIALFAVFIFLALATGTALTSRPITDEGLFADPAYTLATKGYMGSPALRDNAHLLQMLP